MRIPSIVIAALCLSTLALPSAAQTFAVPRPATERYSDQGVKPGTGRSGTAAIEVRALLGRDGTTELEVTTGGFDPPSTRGVLDKVQVKTLAGDGSVLRLDNYRAAPAASGVALFAYPGLDRGDAFQVQANVTGVDWSRTDVVTARAVVALRPDVAALDLLAPATAAVAVPVSIGGLVGELNGDTGARATCRLLADGVEIGAVPGIWIDAGSTVSCEFEAAFATPGVRRLVLRVTDVAPRDDDPANNEVRREIEVVAPPSGFDAMTAFAWDTRYFERTEVRRTTSGHALGTTTETTLTERTTVDQAYGAHGTFSGDAPLDRGTIALRHSIDGTALPMVFVAVSALEPSADEPACRSNVLASGESVKLCSGGGTTRLWAQRWGGDVTYRSVYRKQLAFGAPLVKEETWTSNSGGARIVLAGTYTAELEHEATGVKRQGSLDVPLDESVVLFATDNWATPACVTVSARETVCTRHTILHSRSGGEAESR